MKRLIALLLIVGMLLTGAVACTKEKDSTASNSSNDSAKPLKISMVIMGGPKTPDSWMEKEIEKKLNVDLELIFMPAWEEKNVKMNLLMSDPKTMPDILLWEGMDKEYKQWKDAGLLVDMLPYLKKNGKDILNYYSKDTLFFSVDDGKMFKIPGDVAELSTGTILMREDWLKNLNLQVPTTIDEFKNVLLAFTKNDPDKNGKKDTYGLTGENKLGAFGPITTAFKADPDSFLITSDGTVKHGSVLPEMRDSLQCLQELYKQGVFEPTMFTGNDTTQVWAQGKVGALGYGISSLLPGQFTYTSFYGNNPDAKMIGIDPIKGPNGFSSTDVQSVAGWCNISITKNAKDPARVVAFLNSLCTEEIFKFYKFGQEGVHYEMKDGVFKPLVSQEKLNADGVDLFCWYLERKDKANIRNTEEVNKLYEINRELCQPMKKIKVEFKDKNRPMYAEYMGDLNTLRDTVFYDIITGKKDINAFDEYVKRFYAQGGKQVEEEANEFYKKQADEQKGFDKFYSDELMK